MRSANGFLVTPCAGSGRETASRWRRERAEGKARYELPRIAVAVGYENQCRVAMIVATDIRCAFINRVTSLSVRYSRGRTSAFFGFVGGNFPENG